MTTEEEICPNCGGPLTFRIEGRIQGLFCPSCNEWAVVATYFPEIQRDGQLYQLSLAGGNPDDMAQVRAISAVTALNFLQSKQLLANGKGEIARDLAPKIKEIAERLSEVSVPIAISPEFPYV